ncbi:MAG: hypothetical protein HY897_04525 [Deltaproteobacteria bacterium]|nr:hypothetical protein [Deltaproteobacteria bacterium]
MNKLCSIALVAALAAGCTGARETPVDGEPADAGEPDSGAAADAGAADAGTCLNAFDAGAPATEQVYSCAPKVLRDKEGNIATKFALSLFHFNLQYVATDDEADKKKYEDAIIKIGFAPILDILDAHPSWTLSLEFQGYMLEQMAKLHPKVFDKFKESVKTCQSEFVSFHYSDQLFIAYGERDMAWSHALNEEVFDITGVHPSGVVFTQEGQFGEGMLDFMKSHERTIALYPRNLLGYFTGHDKAYPLWDRWGTLAVPVGTGFDLAEPAPIKTTWTYFNDGELLTTGGFSPYFVDTGNYNVDEASIQKYVDELSAIEAQGYVIASVGDYVETIKALGLSPRPLPDPLDGTWQPGDTFNVGRWMGVKASNIEMDNRVLTSNYRARTEVLAAETMAAAALVSGVCTDAAQAELHEARRELALAQVSDSTGWFPATFEVDYSLNHASLSSAAATEAITTLKAAMGIENAVIDTAAGTVATDAEGGSGGEPVFGECPADIAAWQLAAGGYDVTRSCAVIDNRVEARLAFNPATDVVNRLVELAIPADTTFVEYTPALLDHYDADKAAVKYPSSEFLQPIMWIPAANGLVGLGGGEYLVKHCGHLHLAVGIDKGPPGAIRFKDENAPLEPFEWRLSVVTGDAAAGYEWAKKINTHPTVHR